MAILKLIFPARGALMATLTSVGMILLSLFTRGCGSKWPPPAENRKQLDRLPDESPWIRGRGLTDADLSYLGRFRNLNTLDFVGGWGGRPSRVTAKGLNAVAELQLPRLTTLSLGYSDLIDDEAVAAVARIKTLQTIQFFSCNRITGAGIANLASLDSIDALFVLDCNGLTDADLNGFAKLRNVKRRIELGGCRNITMEGVHQLQVALPNCAVEKHDWDARK
jgi:uncharacterized protein YjhX (UPF0386 family)